MKNFLNPKMNDVTKYIVFFIVFLILVNVFLGSIMISEANSIMKAFTKSRMLDVANTSASMMDGDALAKITYENRNDSVYQKITKDLSYFSNTTDLEYIYFMKIEDGKFKIVLDPDFESPDEYGEEVVCTDAMHVASLGTPAVDEETYSDKWGTFFSSYSPVYDSDENIVGIMGVDFNEEWHDAQMNSLSKIVMVVTIASVVFGLLVMAFLTRSGEKSIKNVHNQLNELSGNIEGLMVEISKITGLDLQQNNKYTNMVEYNSTNIDSLGRRILTMEDILRDQIKLVEKQAFIDGLTGISNKMAYLRDVKGEDDLIEQKGAKFSVGLFDLNGLKAINDNYGHEYGDIALVEVANILSLFFDKKTIYRIGGDEFVVIIDTNSELQIMDIFNKIDIETKKKNIALEEKEIEIGISKGFAIYNPKKDREFQDVFRRADQMMYEDKKAYYSTRGNRRQE